MELNIETMKARWPLFKYATEYGSYIKKNGVRIFTQPWGDYEGQSMIFYNDLSEIQIDELDSDHQCTQAFNEYMEKYPNLFFYINRITLLPDMIWIRRGDRDAEGMGSLTEADAGNPEYLSHMNELAAQAKQEDWFWCTGCDKPQPKSEYAYFYFAGSYCNEWRDAHPDHYRMAMDEDYN